MDERSSIQPVVARSKHAKIPRLYLSGKLNAGSLCDTMSHMKAITIRELHQETGRWVRQASSGDVYVTERGQLIAKIVAAAPPPSKPYFADPRYTRAFLRHRKSLRGGTDATEIISQDRDREAE